VVHSLLLSVFTCSWFRKAPSDKLLDVRILRFCMHRIGQPTHAELAIIGLTTAQSDRLDWRLSKNVLYPSFCIQLHYHTTLPSLSVRLSLLSCDDAIFSRNSLNRSAILGTVCMTSSHLNVIPPFLTDCGILQFTPSLRSEQNGTAPL